MAEHQRPTRKDFVVSSVKVYAVMAFVGFEICWWFHGSVAKLFSVGATDWYQVARLIGLGSLFLMLGQLVLEAFFPSYRHLRTEISKVFQGLDQKQVFLLALVSSVGEEILFRGAIQPYLGIVLTSVVFGLLHADPSGRFSLWMVWSFVGGLVMGYSVIFTESLWTAIGIHFIVNFYSLSRLSKEVFPSNQERQVNSLQSS